MRSRKEDGKDEVVIPDKHHHQYDDKKPYPYSVLFKNLAYAVAFSFLLSFIFISHVYHPGKSLRNPNLDRVISTLKNMSIGAERSFSMKNETVGKCDALWTNEILVGRCFGLTTHSDIDALKQISHVNSDMECKDLCCDLGDNCITWQYWLGTSVCKLGGIVRLGDEAAPTVNWCEPNAPISWFGKTVVSRNGNEIVWGPEVSTQCFGLGPEKKNPVTETPLSVEECEEACIKMEGCSAWQAHPSRGCFYSDSKQVYCEPYGGLYTGGRKCKTPNCPKS